MPPIDDGLEEFIHDCLADATEGSKLISETYERRGDKMVLVQHSVVPGIQGLLELRAAIHASELQRDIDTRRSVGVGALHVTREQMDRLIALFRVIANRTTDTTHLTVEEVARMRGVSTRTIRNWIKKGIVTLENVPGTRLTGIPIAQAISGWLDIRVATAATERQRQEGPRENKRP